MEKLSRALESVQEDLLILYEKDSTELRDQIDHWRHNRREQVLLYVAKKNGVMRLGMTPVPPLAASHQRAKDAIEQGLLLESLAESPYAGEEWTLQDTSRERVLAPPAYCFKKRGLQIDVRFGGETDNVSRYVLWQDIYHQNATDAWVKTSGKMDKYGLYYVDDLGMKVYYVDFIKEAQKYSRTHKYEVLTVPAVSTSTSPAAGRGDYSSSSSPWEKSSTPAKRRRKTPTHRPLTTRGSRGRRGPRELGLPQDSRPTPPSPEEVGGSHETVATGGGGRLGRLLLDARDPPVLVLTGDPNSLKCLRYRLKSKYFSLFDAVSTTFKWTGQKGSEKWGPGRMMLAFRDEKQRQNFVDHVHLPKTVHWFLGSLGNL